MAGSPTDLVVRAAVVVTIVVVVTIWGVSYKNSQAEKNNPPTVVEADSIAIGAPQAGKLLIGQQQAWEFSGSKGQRIVIAIDGNWDSLLALYMPGGIKLLTRDGYSAGGGRALIDSVTLPEDGIYRIVLSGENGGGGQFQLTVTESITVPQPSVLKKVGN